jgi:hypothetical protein
MLMMTWRAVSISPYHEALRGLHVLYAEDSAGELLRTSTQPTLNLLLNLLMNV